MKPTALGSPPPSPPSAPVAPASTPASGGARTPESARSAPQPSRGRSSQALPLPPRAPSAGSTGAPVALGSRHRAALPVRPSTPALAAPGPASAAGTPIASAVASQGADVAPSQHEIAELHAALDEALSPVASEISLLTGRITQTVNNVGGLASRSHSLPDTSRGAGNVQTRSRAHSLPPGAVAEYQRLRSSVASSLHRALTIQTAAGAPSPPVPPDNEVDAVIRTVVRSMRDASAGQPSSRASNASSQSDLLTGCAVVLDLAGEGAAEAPPVQADPARPATRDHDAIMPVRQDTHAAPGAPHPSAAPPAPPATVAAPPAAPPAAPGPGAHVQPMQLQTRQDVAPADTQKSLLYKTVGVPGAHLAQQVITCGVPTFAREMVAIAVTEGLKSHPTVAIALQGTLALSKVYLEKTRREMLERHPDASARTAHGLTQEQWDAHSPREQQSMIANMRAHSDGITAMQTISTVGNLALAAYGLQTQGTSESRMASGMLGQELRNVVYVSRDAMQGLAGTTTTHGAPATNRPNMRVSSAYYGVMQGIGSVLGGMAVAGLARRENVVVAGTTVTGTGLQGEAAQPLDVYTIAKVAAGVAAVRAGVNTAMESIEAYVQNTIQVRQGQAAGQVNNRHRVDFAIKAESDVSRVRNHGVARDAWNNVASFVGQAMALASGPLNRAGVNENSIMALDGLAQAASFGATYLSVNTTYQAHAEGRRLDRQDAARSRNHPGGDAV